MATDTATTQTDTKPAEAPQAATPAKPAASTTQAKAATSKPRAKKAAKPRAKTASKARTRSRSTASSTSRSRTASKSRTRKPAERTTTRTETATAPRAEAVNGGQQFVAGVIDAQERSVTAVVDYQIRAAELSQIPGATAIAGAQAQVLRGVTNAYASAARAFLK